MAKITINGTDVQLRPLTYGEVKANKETVDQVTAEGLTYGERVEAAVAFLHLSAPSADFDSATPASILVASMELYGVTFFSPQPAAPVEVAP